MTTQQSSETLVSAKVKMETLRTSFGTSVYLCPDHGRIAHCEVDEPQFRETLLIRFGVEDFGLLIRLKIPARLSNRPLTGRKRGKLLAAVTAVDLGDNEGVLLKGFPRGPVLMPVRGKEAFEPSNGASENDALLLADPLEEGLPPKIATFVSQVTRLLATREDPRVFLSVLAQISTELLPEFLDDALNLVSDSVRATFLNFFLFDYAHPENSENALCASLLSRLPHAGWIADALTELYLWKKDRDRAAPNLVDASYDFLGREASWEDGAVDICGLQILTKLRELVHPRRQLAVIACARDEGPWVLEWLAYHRVVGVEHFFIYTNHLTDGSDRLLQCLHDAGAITWIDNSGGRERGIDHQIKAYAHALTCLPAILDYRWCLAVDLDEWFLPDESVGYQLPTLLAGFEDKQVDAVVATWRINAPGQNLRWSNQLSCDRSFAAETHPLVKSVFRPQRFHRAAPHVPIASGDRSFFTVDGREHPSQGKGVNALSFLHTPTFHAEVHHFNMRSLEEFIWKYARGENDLNGVPEEKSFRYNTPAVFEVFISHFGKPGPRLTSVVSTRSQEAFQTLLSLKGVAAAYADVMQSYQSTCPVYVRQSAEAVRHDQRVADDVRHAWLSLVERWTHCPPETLTLSAAPVSDA